MPVFIRRTKTGQAPSGGVYYTYRLVSSVRDGDKVRQTTVLNLGADFALPKQDWSSLCSRIENILSGQLEFFQQTQHIESMAQRYAALIIAGKQKKHTLWLQNSVGLTVFSRFRFHEQLEDLLWQPLLFDDSTSPRQYPVVVPA